MKEGTKEAASLAKSGKDCEWGELATFTYSNLHEQVKLADQKAAAVLLATVGLLSYVAKSGPFPLYGLAALQGPAAWSAAAAEIVLSVAAMAALFVVVPRFSSRSCTVPVFFKHICRLQSEKEYVRAIECLSAVEAQRAVLQENFALARSTGPSSGSRRSLRSWGRTEAW
jgi:hypothetical protein